MQKRGRPSQPRGLPSTPTTPTRNRSTPRNAEIEEAPQDQETPPHGPTIPVCRLRQATNGVKKARTDKRVGSTQVKQDRQDMDRRAGGIHPSKQGQTREWDPLTCVNKWAETVSTHSQCWYKSLGAQSALWQTEFDQLQRTL